MLNVPNNRLRIQNIDFCRLIEALDSKLSYLLYRYSADGLKDNLMSCLSIWRQNLSCCQNANYATTCIRGKHLWYSLRKFSARSSEAEESDDMKLLFIIRANITILKDLEVGFNHENEMLTCLSVIIWMARKVLPLWDFSFPIHMLILS